MKINLYSTFEAGPSTASLPPVIILHGLFGSSRNWTSIARAIAKYTDVYSLDQRNHGDSPHADSHTLQDLREDLNHWISEKNFERPPIIIGHSMGGMAAMDFALNHSSHSGHAGLAGLVVVDIAPRDYPPHHTKEFEALSLDVSQYATRSEVDTRMKTIVTDPMVRQFLQMNLERGEKGYAWKVNVPVLKNATHTHGLQGAGADEIPMRSYDGPALFIRGGASDYIREIDFALIQRLFPAAAIRTIEGHGHWLHYSAMQEFLAALDDFFSANHFSQ